MEFRLVFQRQELRWRKYKIAIPRFIPKFKLHFSLEKVEIVRGVNSRIDPETHFLMWDFDDVPLAIVQTSLKEIQDYYDLPRITILSTGKPDGYHAYCFKACSFLRARTILASTPYVDAKFVGVGFMRGYFTLRYSVVEGRGFQQVCELSSAVPVDISYSDVNSFVNYTKRVK